MVKDVEIIRRIDRKQVVPKERHKLKICLYDCSDKYEWWGAGWRMSGLGNPGRLQEGGSQTSWALNDDNFKRQIWG